MNRWFINIKRPQNQPFIFNAHFNPAAQIPKTDARVS